MKPYLIVLKSVQLEACVAFYQSLGIAFEQASHDEKTIHYTTKMDSLVWELYPVNEGEQASNNRLGFQLSPEQGYGKIEASDGRIIYFHKNSILGAEFDKLEVGTEVRFAEEQGERGPQASTVHVIGKHHLVS